MRSLPGIVTAAQPGLRLLRRIWGFIPLSAAGLCLTVTIGLGTYYFGVKANDYILWLTGGALLAVGLLDVLIVCFTAAWLAFAFRRKTSADGSSPVRLELLTGVESPSNRIFSRFLPPLIEASTQVLNPPHIASEWKRNPDQRRQEWLKAERRCLLEEGFRLRRRLIVKDVLGFSAIDWEQEEPLSLLVNPKPLSVQARSILRTRFRGDDTPDPRGEPKGDRVDMRRYSPGDPPRLLLWKVYARTGKLMVRIPENASTTAPRTCAYLVSGQRDETLASLARTMVEGDLLGQGWRFGADGSVGSAENVQDALQLIARSGNPGSASTRGLDSFLREAASEGFGSCLVLVPPVDGDWVEQVAGTLNRSPLGISLLTVGSVTETTETPAWRNWFFYGEKKTIDPNEILSRLNSSAVTDWLAFEPETSRLIPLRSLEARAS